MTDLTKKQKDFRLQIYCINTLKAKIIQNYIKRNPTYQQGLKIVIKEADSFVEEIT